MASIFKQKYTVAGNNGKRIRKQSKFWYIDYKAADGSRKRVKGFKDKQATAQLAAKLEREAERGETDLVDKYKEHRKRPLTEHLEDFRKSLGDTTKHALQTHNTIKRVFEACKFCIWNDISASKFLNCLNNMKDSGDLSQRTFNFYLKAGKQFCKWMVQDQRASESPLNHLKCETITERKRNRRPLEPDAIRRLLEVTGTGPKRFGMTGYERSMLYQLASESGLRANELRRLEVASFNFDDRTVTVKATSAKNKKEDILPLRPDTAKELKNLLQGKLPKAQAFKVPARSADMLKADLADAGIDYIDESGRYADFHALRHTTGSLLAASGVHPKVAQSIMRHSDINLTMSIYTHTLRGQESEAIANLPDLSPPSRVAQVSTGTDGKTVEPTGGAYKKLAKKSDFDGNRNNPVVTSWQSGINKKSLNLSNSKSLKSIPLGAKKEPMSSPDNSHGTNGRYRTRTCDPLIKSQLLCQTELIARSRVLKRRNTAQITGPNDKDKSLHGKNGYCKKISYPFTQELRYNVIVLIFNINTKERI